LWLWRGGEAVPEHHGSDRGRVGRFIAGGLENLDELVEVEASSAPLAMSEAIMPAAPA
jgi:hypothetical protein